MDKILLGNTGFLVSRMGLGCGGHSRLGLSQGKSEDEAAHLVREALDLGINFIDTAESYRTESAVGKGIKGVPRDQVYISTKVGSRDEVGDVTPEDMRARFHACLERLQTDYIDVFNLHGVNPDEYTHARDTLLPALQDLKQQGKIRAIGITEQFIYDTDHRMLIPAVRDDPWEVVMVGFSILNQSARETVLPVTQEKKIGTQCMFAVRRALSRPDALTELIGGLATDGLVDPANFDMANPLSLLVKEGVAASIEEAAYRFCLHEPGMDIILSGTGNVDHLKANAHSLSLPPLPPEIVSQLGKMFAGVDTVSGN